MDNRAAAECLASTRSVDSRDLPGTSLSVPAQRGFLGGTNHAHIHVNFVILPTRRKVPSLRKRSSLACMRGDISPISSSSTEPPFACSKKPFTFRGVAKQLAFDGILRNRGTVQRQIRFCRAWAGKMHGVGQQILPGPGIAGNQQRRGQAGELTGLIDHMTHFRADGNDLAERSHIGWRDFAADGPSAR